MIVNKLQMKTIEQSSGYSNAELMDQVGHAIADILKKCCLKTQHILVLCGKGNNGGDGFVIARYMQDFPIKVCLVDGQPKTEEALAAYHALPKKCIVAKSKLNREIEKADIIIDAIYGFGYVGNLKADMKKICQKVNRANAKVFSIDINSGSESDSGHYDFDSIHSDVTFAIDCYKPFHMLRKEHLLFNDVVLVPLSLKHPETTSYPVMNEEIFFRNFPKKPEDAYKGTYGKTLLIGGSYGMAGAVALNIVGAKTVGSSYINVCLPDECYQIVASHHMTPVYHPFSHENWYDNIYPYVKQSKAIGFGSGATKMSRKSDVLDLLLQHATVPVVLDAEALRLLHHNTWILRFAKCPIILTPHIGEFADIVNQPVEVIRDQKISYALKFAREYKVYVVLKGPNTIIASPNGDCYINQSGNQSLAQAGSGDVLTGMMVGLLTLTKDIFTAICMAVWVHGYISDYGLQDHSYQNFPLEDFPRIMDEIFHKNGF